MPINTGPSNQPKRSSGGGMVNPDFRRLMDFKASGGMNNPMAQQYGAQYGPGAFNLSPSIYYEHFNQMGQPLPPPQQPQQNQGMFGRMMGGMMGMGRGGMGQGGMNNLVRGPSQMMNQGMGGAQGQMGNPMMRQRPPMDMGQSPFNMSGGQFGGMRPGMNQGIGGGFWDRYQG